MEIPDYDKTSLTDVRDALLQGKASQEEQEAAGQFIDAILGLAESAVKFTKMLEANDWVAEESDDPTEVQCQTPNKSNMN
jgi:hypothetical protein